MLAAAFACFGVACVAGLVLAAFTSWWLMLVGAAAVAAAWFYTGGSHPYGYQGLGEVVVFAFFGLVAVAGTAYVQMVGFSWLGCWPRSRPGCCACALLMINNLRDIGSDAEVGKRTLAVRLGDRRSRAVYIASLLLPFVAALALIAGPAAGRADRGHVAAGLGPDPGRPVRRGRPRADQGPGADGAIATGVRDRVHHRAGHPVLTVPALGWPFGSDYNQSHIPPRRRPIWHRSPAFEKMIMTMEADAAKRLLRRKYP